LSDQSCSNLAHVPQSSTFSRFCLYPAFLCFLLFFIQLTLFRISFHSSSHIRPSHSITQSCWHGTLHLTSPSAFIQSICFPPAFLLQLLSSR
jgi:hypothetical protein